MKGIAEDYYKALGKKDIHLVKTFLHPEIVFSDPQESVSGKDNVLDAAERFSHIFTSMDVRSVFEKEDEAAVIYNVNISGLKNPLKAVSHLSFKDGLISKIELFYDMSGFKSVRS